MLANQCKSKITNDDSPKEKNTENNNMNWLKFSITFFSISTYVITILTGINMMNTYYYYGISLNLFTFNLQDCFVIIGKNIITWFGMVGLPYIYYHKNQKEWYIETIKGVYYFLFIIMFLFFYLNKLSDYFVLYSSFFKFRINPIICIVIINVAFISAFYIRRISLIWNREVVKKINNKMYLLFIYGLRTIQVVSVTFVYVGMLVITFSSIFSLDLTEKNEYEIININNQSKIVLFQSNNKLFIADFSTVGKETVIYTKKYLIMDYNNVEITNVEFEHIIIDKNNEKPM